jgi:hypothetical protein
MRSVEKQVRDRKPTDFFTKVSYQPKNIFQPPPGDRILDLSTADKDYIRIIGNGHVTQYNLVRAIQNINEILNVVEGLYEDSVDVTFNIPFQSGWLVQDPYGVGCSNSECIVGTFRDWWNLNRPPATFDGRDAALLFSGKSTATDNWAYIGTICSTPNFAYGIMVGNFPVEGYGNYRYGSTAHEIAHLFSATHLSAKILLDNLDCYNSIYGPSDPNRPHFGELRMCSYTIGQISSHLQINSACFPIEQ